MGRYTVMAGGDQTYQSRPITEKAAPLELQALRIKPAALNVHGENPACSEAS